MEYPGQQLLAQCEDGPWILAQLVPSHVDGTAVSGWIQRFVRTASGEVMEIVKRDVTVPGGMLETTLLPFEDSEDAEGDKSSLGSDKAKAKESDAEAAKPKKHSMYAVDDGQSKLKDAEDSCPEDPLSILRERTSTLLKGLTEYSLIGAVGYARSCLSSLLQAWPENVPFKIEHFGGLSNMLTYINNSFDDASEKKGEDASASALLKSKLIAAVRENPRATRAICRQLIDFSMSQLQSTNKLASEAPVTQTVSKVIEVWPSSSSSSTDIYPLIYSFCIYYGTERTPIPG
jgi:hypothetical protein